MNKYLLVALLAFSLLPVRAQEEQSDKPTETQKGWFVGVQGGMPFGVVVEFSKRFLLYFHKYI